VEMWAKSAGNEKIYEEKNPRRTGGWPRG